MKKFAAVLVFPALASCAGLGTAMQYEQTTHHIQMPDDTYRVFEHPKRDRLMTTPSLGKVSGRGLIEGATLGMANLATPEQRHEAAARKYLDDTGRANCKITRGYLLVDPQYEFFIDCGTATATHTVR